MAVRPLRALRRAVRAARAVADDVIRRPIRERRAIQRWRSSGSPLPPPSVFKQRTVRSYARRFGLTTLVESGTYLGDMVEAQRSRFEKVVSIELSHELHFAARKRLARATNVELLEGNSGDVLPTVMERLDRPALFWLDGHYSSGITARGDLETPIRRELEVVLSSPGEHCILVDDARCFGSGDYPSIDDVVALVKRKRPGWSCTVQDDIIRIHPARQ